MADQNSPGMISGMSPLGILTGDEILEVSQRDSQGIWKTFSIQISRIRTGTGLSAYEVAVKNGFVGTEQEWLASLQGKSAFEIAVALGYVGTEEEWIASLQGQSAYQLAQAEGFSGTPEEWIASLQGASAYEIAVANGFIGTVTEWLDSLKGKSAYQIAFELDPSIGDEQQWLASMQGQSAYQLALDQGFVGTEEEWLESLEGQSAYTLWLALGNVGTEEEFLASLKGTDGTDGESAYQVWLDQGNTGTEAEFLEWLRGSTVSREALQALLEVGPWNFGEYIRTLAVNGGVITNAAFVNFLFVFDKRINNGVNVASADKVPQRTIELGRMEAEGFSYWKNSSATTNDPAGKLPAVPKSELRLLDDGHLQLGSVTDFIELGEGSIVKVVTPGGTDTYDLSKNSVGGAVFITNVRPQNPNDNVGDKVFVPGDITLEACLSTTNNVIVDLIAITGSTRFTPIVRVNGVLVELTARPNSDVFDGSVLVTVPSNGILKAVHNDGAEWETEVELDSAPAITSAIFTSGYPGAQTEAKAGDQFNISVTADVGIVAYEIADFGAFTASNGVANGNTTVTITARNVADRGTTVSDRGFRIRVQKATGAWSEWYNSTQGGSANLVNVIRLNNLYPVITFGATTYPLNQAALKGAESAVVNHTITNADSALYSSSGQLSITNPLAYQPAKTVTRISGTYNNSTPNFTVTAYRAANGAETTALRVVTIASVAPTIAITTPAARLRSGGSNGTAVQNHVITITSNQALIEAPSMNAPAGTWAGSGFVGNANGTVWTRTLRVSDSDTKGTFSWNSLNAKSLSGIDVTTITSGPDYVLGGFVFRTITVPAFPNRQAAIGTDVALTSKLRATNLSKGGTGSINILYQSSIANTPDRYTITGPSDVANPQGNLWYNCDAANASSNTSGVMQIEIEEIV